MNVIAKVRKTCRNTEAQTEHNNYAKKVSKKKGTSRGPKTMDEMNCFELRTCFKNHSGLYFIYLDFYSFPIKKINIISC